MAESIVQINEGTGKKLHTFNRTIGANSVEDEVVILGDQYLASYTIGIPADISTATALSHLVQIMAGASLRVQIRRIEVHQAALATTAAIAAIDVVRLTSAGTGGTVVTPPQLDPADAASGATCMTLPTAKGTEGATIARGSLYFMQTAGASSLLPPPLIFDFDRPHTKPLTIAAGATNGIALKQTTAIAAASVRVIVLFNETNFS